ncbi:MAG: hypothetical protein RLY78_2906 [Pseudomonadota bacterium]
MPRRGCVAPVSRTVGGAVQRRLRTAALALLMALAAGVGPACAQAGAQTTAPSERSATAGVRSADPWESWNRKVFAFNDVLDRHLMQPVAEGYRAAVPQLVRTGIGNFFGNLGDLWSAANHLMQGKGEDGVKMGMRFLTNTAFGLGGVLDFATDLGLPRRSEDFGQTLGRWGVGAGPYLVLPVLGPSTLRDTGGLVLDYASYPTQRIEREALRYGTTGLRLVDTRAGLLDTTGLLDQVALDRYSFMRDAWLQRRLDQVLDGAVPVAPLESFDDPGDSEPAPAPAASASAPAAAASVAR